MVVLELILPALIGIGVLLIICIAADLWER